MQELNLKLLAGDNYRIYNYEIAKQLGVKEAIFLSDIISKNIYYSDRGMIKKEGFFFSTADDIYETTGLTRKEQTTCIRNLNEYIEVKLKGVPAKRNFRLKNEITSLFFNKQQGKTRFTQKVKLDLPKRENKIRPKGKRINNIKNNIKNNIILHSKTSFAGGDINSLIELFKPINPSYERLYSNTTQRKALERLVKKYGVPKMKETIKALPSLIVKPFCPQISTPYQLEAKLGNLLSFYKQLKNKKPKIIKL